MNLNASVGGWRERERAIGGCEWMKWRMQFRCVKRREKWKCYECCAGVISPVSDAIRCRDEMKCFD